MWWCRFKIWKQNWGTIKKLIKTSRSRSAWIWSQPSRTSFQRPRRKWRLTWPKSNSPRKFAFPTAQIRRSSSPADHSAMTTSRMASKIYGWRGSKMTTMVKATGDWTSSWVTERGHSSKAILLWLSIWCRPKGRKSERLRFSLRQPTAWTHSNFLTKTTCSFLRLVRWQTRWKKF